MRRTRVLRRELERPEGPHLARVNADAERSDDVEPVAREVLRLQRSGGNEAVSSLLARDALQMDSGKSGQDEAVSATLIADDPIGVIPLISFSRIADNEIQVILPSTDKDTTLLEMCAKGKPLGTVKISTRGFNLTLEHVYISSCHPGSGDPPVLELTLNAAPPEKKKSEKE